MAKGLAISPIPLLRRCLGGVKTVCSGAVNHTIPQPEFIEGAAQYQNEAAANLKSMPAVVDSLWKCEGFSTTFGKYRLPENTLNDPMIPREAYGVCHVGYGAASTEHTLFDVDRLTDIAETKSEPHYRSFVYEGMGSVLRIYEPGLFKFMCGVLGLIPIAAPPGPDKSGFFAKFMSGFTPEYQRLITHGYGRLVAFSNSSIYKAIDEALELPKERVPPCVMGSAFAFAMMNSEEMPRLLENSAIEYEPPVRAAFQNGLTYGMIFCDWFAPGFLAAWKPQGPLEEKLIGKAREESAANLRRGYLLPFMLENPIS